MMGEIMVERINMVLDKAFEKYADESGKIPYEKDGDFEYFITEDLLVLEEVTGVVWYTGDPNCRFVVAFLDEGEWRFFDVDYVTREIREITKEEAIEKVKTIGVDEQEAKELLGLEGLLGCIC